MTNRSRGRTHGHLNGQPKILFEGYSTRPYVFRIMNPKIPAFRAFDESVVGACKTQRADTPLQVRICDCRGGVKIEAAHELIVFMVPTNSYQGRTRSLSDLASMLPCRGRRQHIDALGLATSRKTAVLSIQSDSLCKARAKSQTLHPSSLACCLECCSVSVVHVPIDKHNMCRIVISAAVG